MNDEALMARYQQGEVAAFTELVGRHEKKLWNFIRRFVTDSTAAEDLLQEVFLRVIRSAAEWQPSAKFSTWIYTIARNLCTDSARRGAFRKAESLDQTPGAGSDESGPHRADRIARVASPSSDAEQAAMNREIASRVDVALAALPVEQREVFLMREVMDMSFAEIATVTKASEPTVKSRMRYALERLRDALDEFRDERSKAAEGSL
jgi:RNA polymerase sigma-70 factor (ECF subfamily)